MRESGNDELLKQALARYAHAQQQDLPDESRVAQMTFSPAFERRMRRRLRTRRTHGRRRLIQVVVAVLLAVLLAATGAMAVPELREPVVQFFVRRFPQYAEYQTTDAVLANYPERLPEELETLYQPTAIPAGFAPAGTLLSPTQCVTDWANAAGETITLYQVVMQKKLNLMNGGAEVRETTINGVPGHTYTANRRNYYLWQEHGYLFVLAVPEAFSRAETDTVAQSLRAPEMVNK